MGHSWLAVPKLRLFARKNEGLNQLIAEESTKRKGGATSCNDTMVPDGQQLMLAGDLYCPRLYLRLHRSP